MPDTRPRVPRSTLAAGIARWLDHAGCTCTDVEIIGDIAPRYGDRDARISIGHDDDCPTLATQIAGAVHFVPPDPNLS